MDKVKKKINNTCSFSCTNNLKILVSPVIRRGYVLDKYHPASTETIILDINFYGVPIFMSSNSLNCEKPGISKAALSGM